MTDYDYEGGDDDFNYEVSGAIGFMIIARVV